VSVGSVCSHLLPRAEQEAQDAVRVLVSSLGPRLEDVGIVVESLRRALQ
jgi:hypothetical protein